MKLMGNVAGVTVPRPDWAQTDPGRADFIRNKPDVEAVRALAAEGKSAAEQRLLRSGDTMTGNLGMSGNRVTGLGAPVDAGDAATKAYVDGKRLLFSFTIPASGWSNWGYGCYGQVIAVNGISENDNPHISVNAYGSDWYAVIEEYSKIRMVLTAGNQMVFYCFEEYPTVDILIIVEVMR